MSTSKFLLGTLLGTVLYFLLDLLFYGLLMQGVFTLVPECDRSWPEWPWLLLGMMVFMGAFTVMYHVGEEEESSRIAQGARFGSLIGLMVGFGLGFMQYAFQEPRPMTDYLLDGVFAIIKFIIIGIGVAFIVGTGGMQIEQEVGTQGAG